MTYRRRWRPSAFLWMSGAVHALSAASLLVEPRRWPLAALAVFANHLAMAGASVSPRSQLLGASLRCLPEAAGRTVALTFDDGPDPEVTPRLLDLLDSANARASFFLVGERAERHPDIVAEISERGHRIENHTFTHPNSFAFLGPSGIAREIDRCQATLISLSRQEPRYFRPPAGIRSPLLEPLLASRGLHLVSWTRRGFDAVDRDVSRVSRRLLRSLAPRDILVIHDGSFLESRSERTERVLAIVTRVLAALERADLQAIPLPDPETPEDHVE